MRVLFLLGALLFAACGGDEKAATGPPPIDRAVFIDALTASYLIEARASKARVAEVKTDVKAEGPLAGPYEAMLKEKGITKEQFQATFDHYLTQPDEFRAIHEEVIARLSKEKDEAAQAR